jgi:hypothetical protein
MATRTLTFTGMKLGADPTAISVDFDGVSIFSGAISNTELGTLFTHDITVNDIPAASVPNPLTNDAIPFLTSTHTVSVECISGATIVVDVTSPPLSVNDETPVIPDPENFGFPTPDYPAQHDDPKYEVTLDGVPVIIQRQQGSQGAWYYQVPAGSTLAFKVMIYNLIT